MQEAGCKAEPASAASTAEVWGRMHYGSAQSIFHGPCAGCERIRSCEIRSLVRHGPSAARDGKTAGGERLAVLEPERSVGALCILSISRCRHSAQPHRV